MHFWDVKFLAQKSGRVKFLTNLMSARQPEDVFSEFQKRKGTIKGKREATGSKIALKTTTHSVCAPKRWHGRVTKMSL